jgi:molybdopterin converting factor small subunit
MSIKVRINPLLKGLTGGEEVVDTEGTTVWECLTFLQRRFPHFSDIISKTGKTAFIIFSLNNTIIYSDEFDQRVKDGDEISIGVIVAGG